MNFLKYSNILLKVGNYKRHSKYKGILKIEKKFIIKEVRRTIWNTNAESKVKYELLQRHEQLANNDVSNAELQADFYRLLLINNYPQIIVERYESSGIASSPECTKIYLEALKMLGRGPESKRFLGNVKPTFVNQNSGEYDGKIVGMNFGSRNKPVHVVISESLFITISKWLKWLIPIGLLTYGATNLFNYLIENGNFFKQSEVYEKSFDMTQSTVMFVDVQGCDEARAELQEIVDFLRNPGKFSALGGKLPKGVLLTGPPGTGKTLLARATAGEASVPFFFMSGSEFDELYVGVGAKRIRELFNQAREKAPAIIFIDELDVIGGKRNPKDQAFSKQTLNQLLVELDGFSQSLGVVVIGATNFPESLDKALIRPGRFDKEIVVDLPDVRGRLNILKHHMHNIEISDDVDPIILARGTPGLSGAELMNLVNQAAIHASQLSSSSVNMEHFEWAKDRMLMGASKKNMVLTEESRINTAYHEAGHAIMAMFSKGATPLYKATILPRGRALGITFQLPELDKVDLSKKECYARLDVCMGGRIAEEIINGKENVTSGCSSDLSNATNVAREMVTSYGMSDDIGPIKISDNWNIWSSKLKDMVDSEIRNLLLSSEIRTRNLLLEKKLELERLAEGLLEYETLTKDEMEKIIRNEPINKEKMVTNLVIKSSSSITKNDELNDSMTAKV